MHHSETANGCITIHCPLRFLQQQLGDQTQLFCSKAASSGDRLSLRQSINLSVEVLMIPCRPHCVSQRYTITQLCFFLSHVCWSPLSTVWLWLHQSLFSFVAPVKAGQLTSLLFLLIWGLPLLCVQHAPICQNKWKRMQQCSGVFILEKTFFWPAKYK